MFSVIFPGQGSQIVGMAKDLHSKFEIVNKLFKEADEILNYPITRLILEGPKEDLNLTENTQPAIFLVSYSIFQVIKKEFGIDLNKANYFAGHSLGEYSALSCSEALNFADTLKILKSRGSAMQNAVPKGEGSMVAVLGSDINKIEKIILSNQEKYECFIANDNSEGQLVVSGGYKDIEKFLYSEKFKINKFKSKIKGNRGSYLECCDLSMRSDDLIFFVEDDYLFEKRCIDEMIFSYSRLSTILKKDIIMCPSDYPFYYDSLYSTSLYFGKSLRWRNVEETRSFTST